MFVLKRKPGDEVLIPGVGTIKVVRLQGSAVYLGFEMPSEVQVLRGEIVNCRSSGCSGPAATACGNPSSETILHSPAPAEVDRIHR